ncbi:MAG: PEP-utilizing enzyme [Chloroflexota bacterium]
MPKVPWMSDRVREKLSSDPHQLAEFDELYETAQSLWPLKEDHSHYIDQGSTAMVRIALAEVGRRLASKGVIEDAEDVWYLDLDEALDALVANSPDSKTEEVSQRKADIERWSKLTPPRHLGSYPPDYDGEREDAQPALNEARELRGTAASQGEATGTAKVVMSPDDFDKIQPGDVLVCRSTAPMWTPLFEVISGLVSEAGGILSHPAVVAREFGLPAVVGVQGATGLIEDGSVVTVSGTDGVVRRAF